MVRAMERELYTRKLFVERIAEGPRNARIVHEAGTPGLIKIEHCILSLAALTQICCGVFYMMPIELDEAIVVR